MAGRSLHVLLAEDNKVNQLVACGILEKGAHTVEVARDGAEVLPMLSTGSFDVVLMDLQMPAMDDFQDTAASRQMERQSGAHITVIAMTAHAMGGYKEKYPYHDERITVNPISKPTPDTLSETCAVE